jgi:sulfur relay (sulfurtransferase) complex TusBCD TusD component (DsrE family)
MPCADARGVSSQDLERINGELINGTQWAELIAAADRVVTV